MSTLFEFEHETPLPRLLEILYPGSGKSGLFPNSIALSQYPLTPHRNPNPLIIQNITHSTTNMTQFTAELNANTQQQQVSGVTYTLNPTVEAFEPGSGSSSTEEA